jgi:dihydroorotase
MLTRRQFSHTLLGLGLLSRPSNFARAQARIPSTPTDGDEYDLLIKGGTVIDPAQGLHSTLDVAIANGKVAKLSPDIPVAKARKVLSAKQRIVTPGLIDIHVHVFEGVGAPGVNADHYCLSRGVTTMVDAGSAGYPAIAGLRKYVIETSASRVYALIDVGALGLLLGAKGAMDNLEYVNAKLTAQAAKDNRSTVLGVKVRLGKAIEGQNDLECLRRAREAADSCKLPLMVHVGDPYSSLKDILGLMRRGDILTHCYNGLPHGVLDANGKLLPEVREARQSGIFFDVGHGSNHLSFSVAEKCIAQDFLPDTISSDLSSRVVDGPVFDLATTISKFILLGLSVDKAIELTTINPARMLDFGIRIGTLQPGNEGDVSIFDLREGTFVFEDNMGEKRTGRQKLIATATVRGGEVWVNESA